MSEEVVKDPDRKKSFSLYASYVFKQSSITVVSSIASTGSIPRKVFRGLVFIIFTAAFLYQIIKFLLYVLQYPTIVSVDIRRPTSYLHPAFTFCNYNRIKRSKFCAKYPDSCIEPTAEFCLKYPFYCSKNKSVPKEESYEENAILDSTIIQELSHDSSDLLFYNYSSSSTPMEIEGPSLRYEERSDMKSNDEEVLPYACYSMFSRVENHLDPVERTVDYAFLGNAIILRFNPEENEKFNPNSPSGILFSIHSQYETANPFDGGIFLRPGYIYKILLTIEEEKLLPPPYKSNCLNYTEKWLLNNKTGPRSKQVCDKRCDNDFFFKHLNCALPDELESKSGRICTLANLSFLETLPVEEVIVYENCHKECRDDCLKQKFTYKVEKKEVTPYVKNGTTSDQSQLIQVRIEVEENEVRTLEHMPQYQEVEAFSYIGGFIGIWLGISLVQVADFLESTFRIMWYFFRRGSTSANRCSSGANGCCCRV